MSLLPIKTMKSVPYKNVIVNNDEYMTQNERFQPQKKLTLSINSTMFKILE